VAKAPIVSSKTVHSKAPVTGKGHVNKAPTAAPGYVPTQPRLGPGPADPASLPGQSYSSEQQQQ